MTVDWLPAGRDRFSYQNGYFEDPEVPFWHPGHPFWWSGDRWGHLLGHLWTQNLIYCSFGWILKVLWELLWRQFGHNFVILDDVEIRKLFSERF